VNLPPPLDADQLVGDRYRLLRRIGGGGMADVWLATDEMLERQIALKFLHHRFAQDAQFVERFRREASSAAGLQHPNVVGVYDRGEWEGRYWIAMEYVEGASLKDLIERGLSIGEAVEIVRQILTGAKFAHERGIVHRDLKPQNVMVDPDGRARVTDFGIARAGASEITQTGSVLGTAQYLSPEQAQGFDVTATSDLYSIGVILYEALTRQVPFDADSPVAVALKQVSEQPRPPSELNPNVSRALDAVVLRALAKDPANRFQSAEEFLRALDAAEADPEGGGLGQTAAYAPIAAAAGAGALAGAAGAGALGADPASGAGPPPEEEGGKPGGWMTKRRAIILGVLALLAAGAAAYALTRPETVTVPRVLEKDAFDARTILEREGFEVVERSEPICAPEGDVFEQDPPAGSDAEGGSRVTITVSTGLQIEVPATAGLTVEEARRKLERDRIAFEARERASQRVKPGRVISSVPTAGTQIDCEEPITLNVSKGPNLIELPRVLGLTREEAHAQLERLGFIVNDEFRDADQAEGTVIGQNPGPESTLPKGTEVTLVISTGAGSVIVPDVEGQSRDGAVGTLQSRGLSVEIVEQETDVRSEDDRVLDQAPAAGTRLRQGDAVTIIVGVYVEPEPPSTTTTSTTDEAPDVGAETPR
jgi:serine/threonine-protein kinase